MPGSIEELLGQDIGGYRLVRILGTGGSGAVLLGERAEGASRQVAIKLLILPPQMPATERAELRARFRREMTALAGLSHPHILPLIAYGEDSATGYDYMVLPYCDGGTLSQRLTGRPLPLSEAQAIIADVAAALDYAHLHGVVHRDIKPGNILFLSDGTLLLADFGIVKLTDVNRTTLTNTGEVMGTPDYMSPEQAQGLPVGPATDCFSLGILAYHMVTGQVPFQGPSLPHVLVQLISAAPPAPRSLRPELPVPLEAVLLQALEKDPTRRFASAGAFSAAFALACQNRWPEGMVAAQPTTVSAPLPFLPTLRIGEPPETLLRVRRQRNIIGAIVAALLVMALAATVIGIVRNTSGKTDGLGNGPGMGGTTTPGAATTALQPTATLFPTATPSPIPILVPTATATPIPPPQPTATSYPTATPTAAPTAIPGVVRWSYTTGNFVFSSPTVVNGIAYIGSADHHVYALNAATGGLIWSYTTGDWVNSSPRVLNGVVYVGSHDHNVYALNAANGNLIWSYATGDIVFSSPAIVNGVVYIGSFDHHVYALSATNGSLIWSYTTGNNIFSSPTVVNGVVYIGSDDNHVYALNAANGNLIWSYTTGNNVHSSPTIVNGVVYVGSDDHTIYALSTANGGLLWSYTTGNIVDSSPIVSNGVVFIGSQDHRVYALNAANGSLQWSFLAGNYVHSSPTVSNGVVYVGSDDGYIYALYAANGSVRWRYLTADIVFSSPTVVNGVV